jgi:hypothetical protein
MINIFLGLILYDGNKAYLVAYSVWFAVVIAFLIGFAIYKAIFGKQSEKK